MILVTAATGQLGRQVVQHLLQRVPASQVAVAVRNPEKAADLAALGVQVRQGDYSQPATLDAAFQGVTRLLLISSNEFGQRVAQHRNAIDAAKRAGVGFIAYTSLLHASRSVLGLAHDHVETESLLKSSGLPYAVLRNGWYTENYAAGARAAVEHGAMMGSAAAGRISSAARNDYAEAAAVVLAGGEHAGKIYELAGDSSYTRADLAAEIARQSGQAVMYHDLPEADYKAALLKVGLPEPLAQLLADSDAGAAKDALFDDSGTLRRLIGRPTTPLAEVVAAALKA